jgi:hypothetical protein
LDRQMEALANLIQLRPHELTMRKDACAQIQVKLYVMFDSKPLE